MEALGLSASLEQYGHGTTWCTCFGRPQPRAIGEVYEAAWQQPTLEVLAK